MSRPFVQISDVVSIAVMLLMAVALIAGEAGATLRPAAETTAVKRISGSNDGLNVNFDGYLRDNVLRISIDVATDMDYFRGEDE